MISAEFDVHVGNVTAVHRWSDTHVSSRGGGGYVSAEYGGTISAPTITSNVVQRQEIYSRDHEGRERRLDLSDAVVGFREGNGLLLVQWKPANRTQHELLYLLNVDTHEALAPDITFHRRTWSLFSGFWTGIKTGLLATLVAFLATAYLNDVDVSRALSAMTAAGVNQPAPCAQKELTLPRRDSCPKGYVAAGQTRSTLLCRCASSITPVAASDSFLSGLTRLAGRQDVSRSARTAAMIGLAIAFLAWLRRNYVLSLNQTRGTLDDRRDIARRAVMAVEAQSGIRLAVRESGTRVRLSLAK